MTEIFHKMSLKATEIQEAWVPKVGDWTDKGVIIDIFWLSGVGTKITTYYHSEWLGEEDGTEKKTYDMGELTYLPSQKDLQGMIPDDCEIEVGRNALKPGLESCKDWYALVGDNKYSVPLCTGDTPNQALIQAAMYELYKKKWNEEGWKIEK